MTTSVVDYRINRRAHRFVRIGVVFADGVDIVVSVVTAPQSAYLSDSGIESSKIMGSRVVGGKGTLYADRDVPESQYIAVAAHPLADSLAHLQPHSLAPQQDLGGPNASCP